MTIRDTRRFCRTHGSPDGKTPAELLQTIDVSDPTQLAAGTYTAAVDAALAQMTEADYLLAKLDINDQVYETSKANNTSAPWSGMFEQDDGTVYVVEDATYDTVTVGQDAASGDVTVSLANEPTSQTFSGVSGVVISTPRGNNSITVAPSVTALVSVFAGSGSTVSGQADNLPDISISADLPTASEAPGSGQTKGDFTLQRDGDTSGSLTVNYTVTGSAWSGYDYQPLSGSATFAAGSDSTTIPVIPLDAGRVGDYTTVMVRLASGGNYSVDPDNPSATVTIYDNDLPTVSIAATDPDAKESGGDSSQFTVTTSDAIGEPLVVNYTIGGSATNGQGYQTILTSIVIPANSTTATIAINPLDLGLTSGSQTVVLTLGSGSGYTVSQSPYNSDTVTIEDNDGTNPGPANWSSDDTITQATNSESSPYVFSGPATFYITDAYYPGDVYKVYDNGNLILTTTIQDNSHWGVKSYRQTDPTTCWTSPYFSHGQVSLGPGSHSVVVQDTTDWSSEPDPQDYYPAGFDYSIVMTPVPTLAVSSPVAVEGDDEVFTVTLSKAVDCTVSVSYQTVNGTATAGTDYTTKSGMLTFSPNQTSQTVTVQTQLDGNTTSDLGFSLVLGTPTVSGINGGGSSGTATIQVVTGSITIYNPDGTASDDGTVDVGDSVPMTVRLTSPAAVDGQFMLSYDTDCFKITTDAAGNNVVAPDTTQFTASTGGTQLYLWGVGATF